MNSWIVEANLGGAEDKVNEIEAIESGSTRLSKSSRTALVALQASCSERSQRSIGERSVKPPGEVFFQRKRLNVAAENVESKRINLLRWNDVPRTSRIFRSKDSNIFSVLSIFK